MASPQAVRCFQEARDVDMHNAYAAPAAPPAPEPQVADASEGIVAVALYDYQAGAFRISVVEWFSFCHCYPCVCFVLADEDELTFDPGERITNIEKVAYYFFFL